MDFSKLNIKIDIEDDEIDDLIDFKHLEQRKNVKNKRKGLFRKGGNKAQMNTIREESLENSIALDTFPPPSNDPSDGTLR